MLGLRVGTKPCLQKHLYEPAVLTQREFLQGLWRTPGSVHSLMSEKKEMHKRRKSLICKDLLKPKCKGTNNSKNHK